MLGKIFLEVLILFFFFSRCVARLTIGRRITSLVLECPSENEDKVSYDLESSLQVLH